MKTIDFWERLATRDIEQHMKAEKRTEMLEREKFYLEISKRADTRWNKIFQLLEIKNIQDLELEFEISILIQTKTEEELKKYDAIRRS